MPESLEVTFDSLSELSRRLHGHMYVLPVAAWILEGERTNISVADAMAGLGGRADRPRVIEALVRLDELGALEELPRPKQKNSPRFFLYNEDPYWAYAAACVSRAAERVGGSA